MGERPAPFELVLRFDVTAPRYDDARAVGRRLAERIDGNLVDTGEGWLGKVALIDLRVERKGATRP